MVQVYLCTAVFQRKPVTSVLHLEDVNFALLCQKGKCACCLILDLLHPSVF